MTRKEKFLLYAGCLMAWGAVIVTALLTEFIHNGVGFFVGLVVGVTMVHWGLWMIRASEFSFYGRP